MKIEMNLEEFKQYASSVGIKVLNLNGQSVAVEMSIGELLLEEKNAVEQIAHPVEESEVEESDQNVPTPYRSRIRRTIPVSEINFASDTASPTSILSVTPESVTPTITNTGHRSLVVRDPSNQRLYVLNFDIQMQSSSFESETLLQSVIRGRKIMSIKNVMRQLNLGLLGAKNMVEANWDTMFQFASQLPGF